MNAPTIGAVRRAGLVASAAIGLLLTMLALGAVAGPALADSTGTIHTWGSVNLRSGPDTGHDILDVIPANASPTLQCYVQSEDVYGVDVWWRATWEGQTGYFASYYDDSHYSTDDAIPSIYGIPSCGVYDDPGTQSDPEPIGGDAGGIDLQAYCDSLGWQAQVILTAPHTPNDWGCLYRPLFKPSLAGASSLGGAYATPVPNIVGASIDFQEACRQQYGSNMAAVLTDSNDVRSWRCYSLDLANVG